MALEIERKFLVADDRWRLGADLGRRFCQGYLAHTDRGQVRVRQAGGRAYITVKGARRGITRQEFEYAIPVEEAEEMLQSLCLKPLLEKTRYEVDVAGVTWEVDVIHGVTGEDGLSELVLAEVELDHPHQPFVRPPWIGREVTHDLRYSNAELVRRRRIAGVMPPMAARARRPHLAP